MARRKARLAMATGRSFILHTTEVAVLRELARRILEMIDDPRPKPLARCWFWRRNLRASQSLGEVRLKCGTV
jgi:hypothetical protein